MGDLEKAHRSFTKDLPVIVEGQIKWRGINTNAPNHNLCKIEISDRDVLCSEESVTEEDLPAVSGRWKELRHAGRIQSKLRHPTIQRFVGALCRRNNFSIVLEHGHRGHCGEFVKEMVGKSVSGLIISQMKCKAALEVVDGAEYLHGLTPTVLHMNLRSRNVIITQNFTAKISSFEYSIRSPADSSDSWKRALPEDFEEYLPPESVDKSAIPSQKWDVYSFGKFWFELHKGADAKIKSEDDAESQNEFPPLREVFAAAAEALDLKPLNRPTFNDLQQRLAEYRLDCELGEEERKELVEKCPLQNNEEPRSSSTDVSGSVRPSESSSNGTSGPKLRRRPENQLEPDRNGRQNANGLPENGMAVVRPNVGVRVFNKGVTAYWRLDVIAQRHPVLAFLALLSVVIGVGMVYVGVPNKPPTCLKRANPANGGSSHCYIDDRNLQICEYSCPPGSAVIPVCGAETCLDFEAPITATCVAHNTWSLEVPYCQKEISCKPFHAPKECRSSSYCLSGDVKRELYPGETYTDLKNGSECYVDCWPGYNAEPRSYASCLSNGEWNSELPKCKKPVCPHLKLANYVSAKCTEENVVGSDCTFSCTRGREMTGPSSATCLGSREWSAGTPSCQCPRCRTGPACEFTTSWVKISSNLGSHNKINYDGHEIVCKSRHHWGKYKCRCSGLGREKQCGTYGSDGGSCEHSLAQFIRDAVNDGVLTKPCDYENMQRGC